MLRGLATSSHGFRQQREGSFRLRRVDALVLTHLDANHIGGARSVRAALPVGAIFVPDPLAMPAEGAASCVAGGFWIWDDVRFEWLHPPPGHGAGEARSCVLKVSGAGGSALLIADLDAGGSRRLLAGGARLAADTLLAPYQGTKPPPAGLLAAVGPGRIWLSTGRGNRWGHPKPEVLAAWAAAGVQPDDTAAAGALLLDVPHTAFLHRGLFRSESRGLTITAKDSVEVTMAFSVLNMPSEMVCSGPICVDSERKAVSSV